MVRIVTTGFLSSLSEIGNQIHPKTNTERLQSLTRTHFTLNTIIIVVQTGIKISGLQLPHVIPDCDHTTEL